MFGFNNGKNVEISNWDFREIARQITLNTGVYVSPDEVNEMPEYLFEEPLPEDDAGQLSYDNDLAVPVVDTACFYVQTKKTTLLCKVTAIGNHYSYTVKKIDW